MIGIGEIEALKYDPEDDVWVTRVKWGVRSPPPPSSSGGEEEEELALTGWDVLTIVGGKIKACYTFLDAK